MIQGGPLLTECVRIDIRSVRAVEADDPTHW
jgi:hypothetical protein